MFPLFLFTVLPIRVELLKLTVFMAFDSNYQYFKGYTWSFNGYQKKEKEKGQLAYPSPLTHTHNRRIRGNPASGGAWSSPGASAYDGCQNEIKRKTKGQLAYFSLSMQVDLDEVNMCTKFCKRGLFGFGDFSHFCLHVCMHCLISDYPIKM